MAPKLFFRKFNFTKQPLFLYSSRAPKQPVCLGDFLLGAMERIHIKLVLSHKFFCVSRYFTTSLSETRFCCQEDDEVPIQYHTTVSLEQNDPTSSHIGQLSAPGMMGAQQPCKKLHLHVHRVFSSSLKIRGWCKPQNISLHPTDPILSLPVFKYL